VSCHHNALDIDGSRGPASCSQCRQVFTGILPVDAFPTVLDLLKRPLDTLMRAQLLSMEAERLHVRLEYDWNIYSRKYGKVVGVRKAA